MAKKGVSAPTLNAPVEKKTIHDENWLFGTLGDEWIKISEKDGYPEWTKPL